MFLAERPGRIVTLTEVLDGVWGKSVVTPHSVYEAIAALRQALGDSSDSPAYIVTLPRRGYRLIATVVPPSSASAAGTGDIRPPVAAAANEVAASVGSRRSKGMVWVGVAATLGMILVAVWLVRPVRAPSQRAFVDKSIAVLPFADLSEGKNQEYLADGLAEELLEVLANLPGLRVIGRTSSFQFKNKNDDVRSIGAQLGVAYVVEGSVRRIGSQLRVAAQLIRASDGAHHWSGTFDKNVNDTLQVQTELAAAIGRALEISVANDWAANRTETANAEAIDHYLQGLHALDSHNRAGAEMAANQFQAALAIDPKFASAHMSLGMTYYVQAAFGFVPPNIAFPQVREEALQALELNPRSAVPHALLARVATLHSWDWNEAKRESDTALALGPRNSFALYTAGDLAGVLGNFERAEQLFRASLVSDPLNPETHFMLAQAMPGGELDAAEAEVRRCLAIAPTYAYGHQFLAYILMLKGFGEEAVKECKLEPPDGSQTCLAHAYYMLGRKSESDAALEQALKMRPNISSFDIAGVFAYRGQRGTAFEWLERAYREKDAVLAYIKSDPSFESLRADSRYKALLHKMNLPE
jgi:TolB-like protein/Flp pilus assembly protein TadD